jgi:NADH-quinone oxidoreductase subunit N
MLATLIRTAQASSEVLQTPKVPWGYLAPQLVLVVAVVVGLVAIALVPRRLSAITGFVVTVVASVGSLIAVVPLWHRVGNAKEGPISAVAGAVGVDRFSLFITAVVAIGVFVSALLSLGYYRREGIESGEVFLLMLMAASGAGVVASANDLIVLFVGVEILSIATYVLAASHRRRQSSLEAGFKYFILGGLASAFLIYGIAMMYGATGTTSLQSMQEYFNQQVLTKNHLVLVGLVLMLVGFGFKVAATPFHMWAPDVYQGAPSPVTAFMASVVKAAAFGGLVRVFVLGFASYTSLWRPVVAVLAVASLLVGSIAAVVQTNVKRMLAYSSIAHAGFILLGVEAANEAGTAAVVFYLLAYAAMVLGSFGVVAIVGRVGDGKHSLDDYRGLSKSRPGLALVFALFLLAQSGAPFTAGFVAKLGVVNAVIEDRHWPVMSIVLASIAMLSAAISAFLYLRIIVAMYFSEPEGEDLPIVRIPAAAAVGLTIAAVLTLGLGVWPGPATDLSRDAVPVLVEAGNR